VDENKTAANAVLTPIEEEEEILPFDLDDDDEIDI
jgi:hypothetical protein